MNKRLTLFIDFFIFHRPPCACWASGWVLDRAYKDGECGICYGEFGYDVPITMDEGRLQNHLSCEVERELARKVA